jgi:hypothetical protein
LNRWHTRSGEGRSPEDIRKLVDKLGIKAFTAERRESRARCKLDDNS